MKYIALSLFSWFLPAFGHPGPQKFALPSSLYTSAYLWARDVGHVSQFLDESAQIPPADFIARATTALAFEKEGLGRKALIDEVLHVDPSIQAANEVLVTEGTSETVLKLLEDMAGNGVNSIGNVQDINNIRCGRVLPAIDAYFNAVTGLDASFGRLVASRPEACF
ncbi:hypothetical protein BS50DRAFT_158640 [Corynespora cassiicola Philippines]|uniref:Uncharacterized protein n=1 Tax=Corynespora cassiicola Philippines TaxID=1448308 RepID=A0A2T2MZU4_CORCC|nr:hypothetical protein BS50DRAFT_158640 [Corynespora cassiicola Philippines]